MFFEVPLTTPLYLQTKRRESTFSSPRGARTKQLRLDSQTLRWRSTGERGLGGTSLLEGVRAELLVWATLGPYPVRFSPGFPYSSVVLRFKEAESVVVASLLKRLRPLGLRPRGATRLNGVLRLGTKRTDILPAKPDLRQTQVGLGLE